jgi:hypothetical protein
MGDAERKAFADAAGQSDFENAAAENARWAISNLNSK